MRFAPCGLRRSRGAWWQRTSSARSGESSSRGTTRRQSPSSSSAASPSASARFVAVDNQTLNIYEREFHALLGPSGCGKTTLLRMLAGFEEPTEGSIWLDGKPLSGVPPHKRPVNMMFQSYALFPHMTVEGNVAFGLKQDRMPKAEIAGARRRDAEARQDGAVRQAQARPALRRAAAARGARPRHRQAAEGAAPRRAARRARQEAARGDAVRADRPARRRSASPSSSSRTTRKRR